MKAPAACKATSKVPAAKKLKSVRVSPSDAAEAVAEEDAEEEDFDNDDGDDDEDLDEG
jgi:hypothetical protein